MHKVNVIKTTQRFGLVDIFERVQLSKNRVDPPCSVFLKCVGCKFQDLHYEIQLEFKIQVVRDSLSRIGGIELPEKIEVLASDRHCLLYTSPSPRDGLLSRMPSSA